MNEIKICMGSSCFARGNSENLEFIESYIRENKLEANIDIYGERCTDICDKGPNIIINGVEYNDVTIEKIKEELRKLK